MNNTSSEEDYDSENSGSATPISLAEVAEVVKKLFSGKATGVDKIRPEMKALDIVGLSWLTCLFIVRGGRGQYLWRGRPGWWSPFKKKGTGGCAPTIGG